MTYSWEISGLAGKAFLWFYYGKNHVIIQCANNGKYFSKIEVVENTKKEIKNMKSKGASDEIISIFTNLEGLPDFIKERWVTIELDPSFYMSAVDRLKRECAE